MRCHPGPPAARIGRERALSALGKQSIGYEQGNNHDSRGPGPEAPELEEILLSDFLAVGVHAVCCVHDFSYLCVSL